MIQKRSKNAKQIGGSMQKDGYSDAIGFVVDVSEQQSKTNGSGNHV